MHDLETKMLLKHYLEQGLSKAELARRFGVNRRTIYYLIATGQLDHHPGSDAVGYSPPPKAPQKLGPYKAIINARLEAYPKLTARRLFEEVRAAGYEGGYSRLSECGPRCARANQLTPWCATRHQRAAKDRWTLAASASPGDDATRSWWS